VGTPVRYVADVGGKPQVFCCKERPCSFDYGRIAEISSHGTARTRTEVRTLKFVHNAVFKFVVHFDFTKLFFGSFGCVKFLNQDFPRVT
jgi:hypothetical protein